MFRSMPISSALVLIVELLFALAGLGQSVPLAQSRPAGPEALPAQGPTNPVAHSTEAKPGALALYTYEVVKVWPHDRRASGWQEWTIEDRD